MWIAVPSQPVFGSSWYIRSGKNGTFYFVSDNLENLLRNSILILCLPLFQESALDNREISFYLETFERFVRLLIPVCNLRHGFSLFPFFDLYLHVQSRSVFSRFKEHLVHASI